MIFVLKPAIILITQDQNVTEGHNMALMCMFLEFLHQWCLG